MAQKTVSNTCSGQEMHQFIYVITDILQFLQHAYINKTGTN